MALPLAARFVTQSGSFAPKRSPLAIAVGERAPDFTLPKQDGTQVRLSELLTRGPAIVYFYPKDETPICTAEACSFRDAYEDFKAAGAEVVGISNDSAEDHASFATNHRLPFILASDKGGVVANQYNVKKGLFGLMAGRVTFVVDRQGIVRHAFSSQLSSSRHVEEALKVLKSL